MLAPGVWRMDSWEGKVDCKAGESRNVTDPTSPSWSPPGQTGTCVDSCSLGPRPR